MPDIADLGFRTDTKDLKRAEDQLDDLTAAANDNTRATDQLEKKWQQGGKSAGMFGRAVDGVGRSVSSARARVLSFVTGLAAMATTMVGIAAGFSGARGFSAAVAELSTLLPTANRDLAIMTQNARALADEFGTSRAAQAQAFYQAVSAGASGAAAATETLTAANKLAIGGITEVTTGVDVLTTAVNAYAQTGLTAAQASDALFVGMKAGKTTIGELASQLGFVIPIAASLGVEFDALVAGVAALTTQGLSTASATTSLRAALSAIAKPASQAQKLAKALGIDFSTTALRAKGLAGFMQDVIKGAHGNADALAILFGSVEALNGMLALAGAGGDKFNEILEQMQTKAGATDEAFEKVAKSLDFRLRTSMQFFINQATNLGTILLALLVPALELVRDNWDNITRAIGHVIDIVMVFVGLGLVRYALALGGSMLSLAKAILTVGSASALLNLIMRAKLSLLLAIGAIVLKITGYWDDFAAMVGEAGRMLKSFLPEGLQEGIDSFGASVQELLGQVGELDASIANNGATYLGVEDALKGLGGTGLDVLDLLDSGNKKATKSAKGLKDAYTDVLDEISVLGISGREWSDMFAGFAQEITRAFEDGKVTAEEFGRAVINILNRIADKLISMAMDALIGSLFRGFFPMASGGVVSRGHVTALASGGVVTGPTLFPMARGMGLMGEAGPEAVMPLTRLPNGKLGVEANGSGAAPVQMTEININVAGARGNQEITEMVRVGVRAGLREYDRKLPGKITTTVNQKISAGDIGA